MVAYQVFRVPIAVVLAAVAGIGLFGTAKADERLRYVAVGETSRPPIGWIQFCETRPWECNVERMQPRDVQFTGTARRELDRVNRFVNERIKPMTDQEQYGAIERWTYPESGYGDCEDYVLLKRRMLMQLGWPRSALLVTIVRDKKGEGHAVLTVRTDKGEFVLDNQVAEVLPWAETGYRYIKRQAQHDPNVWVALGDNRPTPFVAAR